MPELQFFSQIDGYIGFHHRIINWNPDFFEVSSMELMVWDLFPIGTPDML